MANLQDYYQQPGGTPLEWTLGGYALDESNTREDAGLARTRLDTQYGQGLQDLVNNESARGTVRGGWAGMRADRMRGEYDFQKADVSRLMNRQLGDLARNRILATLGVTV